MPSKLCNEQGTGYLGESGWVPFQQVFHRFCSLHLWGTESSVSGKVQALRMWHEPTTSMTSVNDSPLSKRGYRQHCPSLLPGTSVTSGKQRFGFPIWKIDLTICEYEGEWSRLGTIMDTEVLFWYRCLGCIVCLGVRAMCFHVFENWYHTQLLCRCWGVLSYWVVSLAHCVFLVFKSSNITVNNLPWSFLAIPFQWHRRVRFQNNFSQVLCTWQSMKTFVLCSLLS